MKWLIDNNNNPIGKTYKDSASGITEYLKPLRCGESAVWDGSKWVYTFNQYDKLDVDTSKIDKSNSYSTNAKLKFFAANIFNIIDPVASMNMFTTEKKYAYSNTDKVTVVMPSYGKANYLMSAVKNAVNQTRKPDKIILLLMDDKSKALAENLTAIDPIVQCIQHEQIDVASARNYLAEQVSEGWIIFFDPDDTMNPDYIEVMCNSTYANEMNAAVRGTWYNEYDTDTNETNYTYISEYEHKHPKVLLYLNGNVMMHKDVCNEYKYNTALGHGGEDTELYIRIIKDKKYNIYINPDVHFIYNRGTDNSLTTNEERFYAVWKNIYPLHGEWLLNELKAVYATTCKYKTIQLTISILQKIIDDIDNIYDYINDLSIYLTAHYETFDYDILNNMIYNYMVELFTESRERTPKANYSADMFTTIGTIPEGVDLEGRTFDLLLFNDISKASAGDILTDEGNLIINNECLAEIMELDVSWFDRIVYMLKNYACFTLGDLAGKATDEFKLQAGELDQVFIDSSIANEEMFNDIVPLLKAKVSMNTISSEKKVNRVVSLELNNTCNKHCAYCNQYTRTTEEITEEQLYNNFDAYLKIIEAEYTEGIKPQLLGGEPTLLSEAMQIKIIERLQNYREIVLFTNGYDTTCPLYKWPNMVIIQHATTIEELDTMLKAHTYKDGNIMFTYVVLHDEVYKIEDYVKNNTELVKYKLQLSPCSNSGSAVMDCTMQDVKKLINIGQEYNLILNTSAKMVADIFENRLSVARHDCFNNGTIMEVDCIKGTVLGCCKANVEPVPISRFDFHNIRKHVPEIECMNCKAFSSACS